MSSNAKSDLTSPFGRFAIASGTHGVQRPGAHEGGAGGPQAVELAVGCEGQLGEGEPPSWHFVGRKVVTDFGCDTTEAFRLRHVGCCRLIPDDPGHRNLPEAFVGKGDNHSSAYERGRAQNVFYFGGKDVEPADDHHLLQPAGHIENAVLVNVPQVACVVPAVSVERQPRLVAVGLQRVLVGLARISPSTPRGTSRPERSTMRHRLSGVILPTEPGPRRPAMTSSYLSSAVTPPSVDP